MNYLAHAFLSFNNPHLLVGNMISDYVKGKKQYDFPMPIQHGIKLHRAIDEYTDTHAATYQIKKYFAPAYGLYAGAFADVTYDYFLANDKQQFVNEAALKTFTQDTYTTLGQQKDWFPEKFALAFTHMQQHDWLYNYQFEEGISKSFEGLRRRAKYITETNTAYQIFLQNKLVFADWYNIFFPTLHNFAALKAAEFLQTD